MVNLLTVEFVGSKQFVDAGMISDLALSSKEKLLVFCSFDQCFRCFFFPLYNKLFL